MRQRVGKSKYGMDRVVFPLTLIMLATPGSAVAAPAVDQYDQALPDARGKETNLGQSAPRSQPKELPPAAREQLERSRDGETLAAIATADSLGAPNRPAPGELSSLDLDESDGRSLPAAAFDTLKSPFGLALVLGLAAITALIALATRSARRGEAGGPS